MVAEQVADRAGGWSPEQRRSAPIEAWLLTYGLRVGKEVLWRPNLAVQQIDRRTSLANQARVEGHLDRQHVAAIVETLAAGGLVPPIVVYQGRAGFVNIDGNHRTEAVAQLIEARAATDAPWAARPPTLDAYVVPNGDPSLLELMTRTCNAEVNAKPLTPTEVHEQALTLMAQGHSVEEIARRTHLKVATIRDKRRDRDALRRIKDVGVRAWKTIPATTAGKLCQLQSDVTLKAVAEYVVEAQLKLDAVADLVARLLDARSEGKALEILAQERADWQARVAAARGEQASRPKEPDSAKAERWARALLKILLSGKTPFLMGYHHLDDVGRQKTLFGDLHHAAMLVLGEADRVLRRPSP